MGRYERPLFNLEESFSVPQAIDQAVLFARFLAMVSPSNETGSSCVSRVPDLNFCGVPVHIEVLSFNDQLGPERNYSNSGRFILRLLNVADNQPILVVEINPDFLRVEFPSRGIIGQDELGPQESASYKLEKGVSYSVEEILPIRETLETMEKVADPRALWLKRASELGYQVPDQWASSLDLTVVPVQFYKASGEPGSVSWMAIWGEPGEWEKQWIERVLQVGETDKILVWFPTFVEGVSGRELFLLGNRLREQVGASFGELTESVLNRTLDKEEIIPVLQRYLVKEYMRLWVYLESMVRSLHLPEAQVVDQGFPDPEEESEETSLRVEIQAIRFAVGDLDILDESEDLSLFINHRLGRAR